MLTAGVQNISNSKSLVILEIELIYFLILEMKFFYLNMFDETLLIEIFLMTSKKLHWE